MSIAKINNKTERKPSNSLDKKWMVALSAIIIERQVSKISTDFEKYLSKMLKKGRNI